MINLLIGNAITTYDFESVDGINTYDCFCRQQHQKLHFVHKRTILGVLFGELSGLPYIFKISVTSRGLKIRIPFSTLFSDIDFSIRQKCFNDI